MRDTDIAYIAGIIDGEAYIGIKKTAAKKGNRITPSYNARIQIRMVNEEAIEFISNAFGGKYHKEPTHSAQGRPLFCFHASDLKAEKILKKVRPYLRVKKYSADNVLELRKLQKERSKHRTKITGYRDFPHWTGKSIKVANKCFSDEYVGWCEKLYLRAKEINQTGLN